MKREEFLDRKSKISGTMFDGRRFKPAQPEKNVPSPEEIRRKTAEIRQGWTARERKKRLCVQPVAWEVPTTSVAEMIEGIR